MEITPKSIYCREVELSANGELGKAYIDTRTIPKKIAFQAYGAEITDNCETK